MELDTAPLIVLDVSNTKPALAAGPSTAQLQMSRQALIDPRAFAAADLGVPTPALVTASFDFNAGVLSGFGDDLNNAIAISRNAAGQLLVNGGAVPIVGGTPTVANTALIQVFGLGGADTLTIDEANGALPTANLFGGAGNDKLTGGSGNDLLFGQGDDDTLDGKGGNDLLFGGIDNDVLTGGDGDDQMFGEGGNDRLIWNPGDDTDLFEGGDGFDTAEVNGGNGAEQFTVTANGTRVRFDRLNPAPFSIDIGTSEALVLAMNGGDDSFSATGNLAALISIVVDGGAGNDTILGSNGADRLLGGDGNDFIDGQQGSDTAFLGAGDDVFQWDPGDGSDVVEGQAGNDRLLFNGSAANEIFEVFANGGRAVLTRNVGAIIMDNDDVEVFEINALGGSDILHVRDLAGTDVKEVRVSLAGTIGGTAGDGLTDVVNVHGTGAAEVIEVNGTSAALNVAGIGTAVKVLNVESKLDQLVVDGGAGSDTLMGAFLPAGQVLLTLDGGAGNDTVIGSAGNDTLHGGDDDDTLSGGVGDDQVFGDAGNDRMMWSPGAGNDLMEGGDGGDIADISGNNLAETYTVTANGTRVRVDRLSPAPTAALDIGTTEGLVFNLKGGDDSFSATGNLAALTKITVDGGAGNDKLLGSNGADLLMGGDGNDFIDGQQGNDTALLGAGDDIFQWDPGDGSDVVEGQAGKDAMLFNGSAANEIFALSANGGRALFTRNVGNIVMDLDDVEVVDLNALGGTDTVTVNDLTGIDVGLVKVNLAGTIGGTAGDGAADTVIAMATPLDNVINVLGAGSSLSVTGLPSALDITQSEGANDTLVINGLDGSDSITATTLPAGVVKLTIDGGIGNDKLFGSQGADTLLGGTGSDFIFGDNGNDLALMGDGDDVFEWDPGDGNDTLEGQAGFDAMFFVGSNAAESINIVANGGRALFLRDVANVSMDLDDVERIEFRALGGADNIIVGDLSGTDVSQIELDLRGPNGGGDGAADTVTVNATQGDDVFGVAGDIGGVTVFGLQSKVNIFHFDAGDRLTLNGLGGNDVIDASSLEADGIRLTMNGGLGADVFLGSEGGDLINGGDGDDVALMGAGDDTFVWNPGDDNDVLEGQSGNDKMLFNGANVAESINISANGGRVIFFRNVANVVMDLNDTEVIDFNALGGADVITVNDLSGTDVTQVNINLAASGGGGDGAADTVVVNATNGDDVVVVAGGNGEVQILGLSAAIKLTGFEAGSDRIVINLLAGDDVLEASDLLASGPLLTGDGGDGDDVLIGGDGNDTLLGGNGDDVLIGGPGTDVLDGGPGNNVVIQTVGTISPEATF